MLLQTDATACPRERAFEDEAMPRTACLLRAAISITRDAAVAEDLVQETLLRAWRFFDRFDQGTNCKAWLFRIMLNLSTRVREKRTAESISSIPLDETHAEDHASTNGDFLQQLLIRRAFEALPPDQRDEAFDREYPRDAEIDPHPIERQRDGSRLVPQDAKPFDRCAGLKAVDELQSPRHP